MHAPQLVTSYTSEELTVVADLFEREALPGCTSAELSGSTRSLAARCLVARNVVAWPDDGEVEIIEPHATLFRTLFTAGEVIQHVRHRPAESVLEQWFFCDDLSLRLVERDGIVTMSLWPERVEPPIGSDLGELPAGAPIEAFDEVIRLGRTDGSVTVERLLTVPAEP